MAQRERKIRQRHGHRCVSKRRMRGNKRMGKMFHAPPDWASQVGTAVDRSPLLFPPEVAGSGLDWLGGCVVYE